MEKLRFEFTLLPGSDGKSNVLCITSIATSDNKVYAIPEELQSPHPNIKNIKKYSTNFKPNQEIYTWFPAPDENPHPNIKNINMDATNFKPNQQIYTWFPVPDENQDLTQQKNAMIPNSYLNFDDGKIHGALKLKNHWRPYIVSNGQKTKYRGLNSYPMLANVPSRLRWKNKEIDEVLGKIGQK